MLLRLLLPPWKGCGAHCGLGGQWEPWGCRGEAGAQQVSSAAHCDQGGPADWRLADVPPGDRKGWKDFPGNYRPVSLTSVSGQVTEQVILSAVTRHVRVPPMEGSEAAGMGF